MTSAARIIDRLWRENRRGFEIMLWRSMALGWSMLQYVEQLGSDAPEYVSYVLESPVNVARPATGASLGIVAADVDGESVQTPSPVRREPGAASAVRK